MSIISDAGVGVKRAEGQEYECDEGDFSAEFPGIYEWLARIYLNGKTRDGASLTIKYRSGGVSLCLSAATEGLVGWHQGKTVQEALEGLEKRLQASTMDWREKKEGWVKR